MNLMSLQSTLPIRGATGHLRVPAAQGAISIHAPHTGSDVRQPWTGLWPSYFNPRSPYGERPSGMTGSASPSYFNPRSPYGERPWPWASRPPRTDFNPRSPYGERRYSRWADPQPGTFQSTLPIRGATLRSAAIDRYVSTISIHAPHTGSDVPHSFSSTTNADFNPRSPYGERRLS